MNFLLADAETFDKCTVAVGVGALEVVEQLAPLTDQLEEAPA
jgi:hypothetical protein